MRKALFLRLLITLGLLASVPRIALGQSKPAGRAHRYALRVGVQKYERDLHSLKFTERDCAREVVEWGSVTRPGGRLSAAGAAAIFSWSRGRRACAHDTLHHGLFFHALIEGLRGAADLDKNKEITLPEIEVYVKQRTP